MIQPIELSGSVWFLKHWAKFEVIILLMFSCVAWQLRCIMELLCPMWIGYMVGLSPFSLSLTCSLCWVWERESEKLKIRRKTLNRRKRRNLGWRSDIWTHCSYYCQCYCNLLHWLRCASKFWLWFSIFVLKITDSFAILSIVLFVNKILYFV